MIRLLLTTLSALFLWAALLAAGAGGAVRMVSTSRTLLAEQQPTSVVERRLLADAADGRFDRMGLIEAALVAGGKTDPNEIARYTGDVERLAARLRSQLRQLPSSEARAEALLLALHNQLLNGRYLAAQSDISIAIDRGDFNCLSSVILYVALGRSLGIEIQPAVLPGHIVAVLPTAAEPKPVETTYSKWFSAVRQGRVDAARVPATQHAKPYDRSQAVSLSDPELIALVYYNQGYEHLTSNRFAAAWSANQRALTLDPDNHCSRGNFLATINNWSLDLCKRGEFADARRLVAEGLKIAPEYAPLRANNRHVHRLWVEQLMATGRTQAASRVLVEATRQWPNEPFFAHYLRLVSERGSSV